MGNSLPRADGLVPDRTASDSDDRRRPRLLGGCRRAHSLQPAQRWQAAVVEGLSTRLQCPLANLGHLDFANHRRRPGDFRDRRQRRADSGFQQTYRPGSLEGCSGQLRTGLLTVRDLRTRGSETAHLLGPGSAEVTQSADRRGLLVSTDGCSASHDDRHAGEERCEPAGLVVLHRLDAG